MLRKSWIYILLILIAFCVFFLSENKSTIISDNTFDIADTSIITKVFIADRKGNTISLDKHNNSWTVNNKFNVRKDAINVLLSTIHQIKIQQPVSLSAFDNVIKDLSTTGVKVEIYAGTEALKIYTVGNETSNHLGTYMLLDGSDEPFIMHIPYFNGYLTPRYGIQGGIVEEKSWRKRTVFNISEKAIRNISINNLKTPEYSFSLQLHPTRLYDLDGNLTVFNNQSVLNFINSFREINCESFKNDKSKIEFATPLHELIVNNDTLHTYIIGDSEEKKKEESFNVQRMYATLNSGDLMLIQNYVFNKVLITIDELRQ